MPESLPETSASMELSDMHKRLLEFSTRRKKILVSCSHVCLLSGMSEASFDSGKNASQDNQSDPNEQGPQNTADSVSQSKARKNSLDEAHMTEIDISEDKEVGNHSYTHSEDEDDGDEDEDSQAQSKTSGMIRDNADSETTSRVATEADVKVTVMI